MIVKEYDANQRKRRRDQQVTEGGIRHSGVYAWLSGRISTYWGTGKEYARKGWQIQE